MDEPAESVTSDARPSRERRLAAAALSLLAVGAIILFVVLRISGDPGNAGGGRVGMLDSRRPEVGQRAPDFALVDARDGAIVRRLSDYRGKIVILNWYATWCSPCKAEIPEFQNVFESFPNDVVVVAVNLRESRNDAVGMLDDLGATFPALLDSEGKVASHYRLLGMPSTLLIDREGIIRISGSGRVTEDALRTELAKLGVR